MSEKLAKESCSRVSPRAALEYVVEIGGIDNIGVQQDVSYGLLVNLLPHLPSDAQRWPSKRRKARRLSRVEVCRKE